MRREVKAVIFSLSVVAGLYAMLSQSGAEWLGVDETVVTRLAVSAGREPESPLLDTDQGDLLLFFFLASGAAAGFIAGYVFRGLFPPSKEAGDRI